ncbi:ligand-binding sensor domain-containing protein [Sphingomonas soli]|uniref:ligand-binding sensor domain-containing protein n=1 Tax=Sphingomonas soli TaxID=266127 RepID=UPI0008330128|nr:two-component regulator propeller domain-containing protein [Sphingomonas soli]
MIRFCVRVFQLVAFLLAASPAEALDPERTLSQFHHRRWTAEEGAPPIINNLVQGPDGYIWIASSAGLHRFDGVTFEAVALDRQRSNSASITALMAAQDGSIWVGYRSGEVAVYRGGILRVARRPPNATAVVSRLVQTPDGAIWVTYQTPRGSLQRYADGRWTAIGPDWGLPREEAASMVVAKDGSLWLLAAFHVYRLPPGASRFERYIPHVPGSAIMADGEGRIWRSGPEGSQIIWPKPAGAATAVFPTPPFTGWPFLPRFDRDGNLWGLTGPGIFRVRAPAQAMSLSPAARAAGVEPAYKGRTPLTPESVLAFLEDREGNIWLGTTLGLDQFSAADVVVEPVLTGNMSFGGGFSLLSASDGTVYAGMADQVVRVPPNGKAGTAFRHS